MNLNINKENVKIEGNNIIIKITEELKESLKGILNTSKKLLKDCQIGEVITDNIGVKWIVIRHDEDGTTKLWRKEVLPDTQRFDKENNNFNSSEIQDYLNIDYIGEVEEGFGKENLCIQEVDLTSLDGLTTYGICKCPIRLGGFDEYRNARKQGLFREKNSSSFWLDTPDSTNEGYSASRVQIVSYDGGVGFYVCNWNGYSVRPFISLKSNIFVSVDTENVANKQD